MFCLSATFINIAGNEHEILISDIDEYRKISKDIKIKENKYDEILYLIYIKLNINFFNKINFLYNEIYFETLNKLFDYIEENDSWENINPIITVVISIKKNSKHHKFITKILIESANIKCDWIVNNKIYENVTFTELYYHKSILMTWPHSNVIKTKINQYDFSCNVDKTNNHTIKI